jgi:hypothetical protein
LRRETLGKPMQPERERQEGEQEGEGVEQHQVEWAFKARAALYEYPR